MLFRGLKRKRLVILLSVAVLATQGCRRKPVPPSEKLVQSSATKTSKAAPGLTPEQASQVLARVGDKPITLGDYAAALARMDRFERLRYQSPERRKQLLDEIIAVELLADEARRRGLDRELDTQLRLDQALRDEVLRDLRAAAPTPESLPEPEVREYYDSHKNEFREPERRRISEVVMVHVEEARHLIDGLRNASALDWGQAVRKHSAGRKDSAALPLELEGDLGIFSAPGQAAGSEPQLPEPLLRAAFGIEKVGGVYGEPVLAQGQYHILRLTSRMPARQRTFAEAERSIRVKLVQQRVLTQQQQLIDELRKKIPVSMNQTLLATIKSTPK
jgi:peptidyl-prolyl cis-trans isomerase C